MAQKYLEKINKASTAEYRNRRKIRLMILIITVAAALFEVTDFSVRSYKEYNSSNNLIFPHYEGFFGLFLRFVAASFGAFAVYGVFSDLTAWTPHFRGPFRRSSATSRIRAFPT